MKVDPSTLDARESHKILTSIIIPRPIAWVTTLNEDGSVNDETNIINEEGSTNDKINIVNAAPGSRPRTLSLGP